MFPALIFNEVNAQSYTDFDVYADHLISIVPDLRDVREVNPSEPFTFKESFLHINDLTTITSAGSVIRFVKEENHQCVLHISLSGYTSIKSGRRSYDSMGELNALISAGERQEIQLSQNSIALSLNPSKFNKTLSYMLGREYKEHNLINTGGVSLSKGNISLLPLFKCLFAQIDAVGGDAKILSKLALDDAFYRLYVGLLYPDIFLTDDTLNGKRPYVRPELNRLCEYIAAHLTEAVSLTEMESISGLSARILQRSFQKAFGMPPKQWLRKQRLHAARNIILSAYEPISITSIAYEFCFASPSEFTQYYKYEFGELPSQTR